MVKQEVYKAELAKLTEIFSTIDEDKLILISGLIKDAAFLYAENYILKESIDKTGMIKFHPKNPTLQKELPAAKEYRQNLNSYAIVIKTLSSVLDNNIVEEEDDMDEYK